MASTSFQAIMRDLRADKYAPVYVLHGEESFFIDRIAGYIAGNALSESEKAFNQIVCYGKDVDSRDITDNARQYPMLAQRRVIILKEAQMMRDLYELEAYLARPSESTVLVICHMHKKIDGRTAFARTARKKAVVFESKRLYDNQVPGWIESYLGNLGVRIEPLASMTLVEYLGNHLSKIANELDKLILQIGDEKVISEQHVFDNIGVSKDFNVFELQKALGQRDVVAVERVIKYFVENMRANPFLLIVANLYNYFTRLMIVRSMPRASDKELGNALGLRSNYFLREYRSAAANYTASDLERIIGILRKYDLMSKGVGSRNREDRELLREMIGELQAQPVA